MAVSIGNSANGSSCFAVLARVSVDQGKRFAPGAQQLLDKAE